MSDDANKTNDHWKTKLSENEYYITRQKGTERAFSGEFWNHKDEGLYLCKCCGEPLFDSQTKYDSGSGWPSFFQPLNEERWKRNGTTAWACRALKCIAKNAAPT